MSGHRTPCRKTARPEAARAAKRPRLRPSGRSFGPSRLSTTIILSLALLLILGMAALLTGCGSDTKGQTTESTAVVTTEAPEASTTTVPATEEAFPVTVTDDYGNSVEIKAEPERIVSTAPANTEILFALGLGERIVGVNSLDDYPPEAADLPKVGDFQVNTEAVIALTPDLVVAYAGAEEALEPVQSAGTAVLVFNPGTVDEIYSSIETIGTATGATAAATELVELIKARIAEVGEAAAASGENPKVFYAVDNTLWTSGPGSFVDELLTLAHATNVASMPGADSAAVQAYYQFAAEQLIAADPDIILLPQTAYADLEEFTGDARFASLRAVKEGRVHLIDDIMVTRPGPRIGEGLKILVDLIHPGAL